MTSIYKKIRTKLSNKNNTLDILIAFFHCYKKLLLFKVKVNWNKFTIMIQKYPIFKWKLLLYNSDDK